MQARIEGAFSGELACRCCTLETVLENELEIRENVALAPLTTFGVGGVAGFFAEAHTPGHVQDAVLWAKARSLPLFVVGGGSNLLVPDDGFDGLALQMRIRGRNPLGDGVFAVGAGEPWDEFVQFAVDRNFAGLECLAGIPGSVGGTPVQNVGAYGQEVAETVIAVHAFDREEQAFVTFDKALCRFRYRQSRFNTEEPGRYIVHRVDFQLRSAGAPTLKYADLQHRFSQAKVQPSLVEVANAVRDIRKSKGMLLVAGDAENHTAGSFFKNPVVEVEKLATVASAAGVSVDKVPHWPVGEDQIKLPAAWLLERAGFVKGWGEGTVGISSRHTLALVNRGGATFADVERVKRQIAEGVWEKFGIHLDQEPVVMR